MIGNKIADKIIKVSRSSPQNCSETEDTGFDREVPKERYISPDKRHEFINHLRLK